MIANGHPISEREKTLVFRQGLIRKDLQSALILPSRTETFEQLVESARSYIQSTVAVSSVSSSSQRIFLNTTDTDYCTYCLERTGRKYLHRVDNCNRRHSLDADSLTAPSSKRFRRGNANVSPLNVTCFKCHQQGHYYTSKCPNVPHSSSENRSGSGERGNNRGVQRGSRGSTYNVYGPHSPTHSVD